MAVSIDRNAVLTSAAGIALAAFVAGRLGAASFADMALPLWVALATLPAIALPAGAGARLAFAIPLLVGVAVAVPSPPLRHLAYGAVVAAAFTVTIASVSAAGRIPFPWAAGMVALAAVARIFPFAWRPAAGLLVALAGTILVLRWGSVRPVPIGSEEREPPAASLPLFLLCLALVLVVPVVPLRGALFAPMLAAMMLVLWRGSLAGAAAGLVLALFVGKWAIAAVAVVTVARFAGGMIASRQGAAAVMLPGAGSARGAAAPLVFWPGALAALARAAMAERIAFGGLLILSLLVRTAPALLLALAAILVVARRPGPLATRLSAVTGGFAFVLVALVPSAGAVGAAFPTLLDWTAGVAVAVLATAALVVPPRIGAVLAAAIPLVVLAMAGPPDRLVQPVLAAAGPGQMLTLAPGLASEAIDLAISGANISGLRDGTVLATLRVTDRRGGGWSRELRVGEVADWAAFREGDFFRTLNPRPSRPGGWIEGSGGRAFLRGEGIVPVRIPNGIGRMEIEVAPDLPPGARVHVDRMEIRR